MAEVEVLLEKIAVDVVELHEAEAGRLVAGIEKAEMAAVGDQVAGAAGKVGERIVEQIEAADEARPAPPLSMQPGRVPTPGPRGGPAAVVREVAVAARGPLMLRHRRDAHEAVVRRPGGHGHAGQEIEEPEIALRLDQTRRHVDIAFMEQQEPPDQRHSRLHGKEVHGAVKTATRRLLGAEDRDGVDGDAPDSQRRWGATAASGYVSA